MDNPTRMSLEKELNWQSSNEFDDYEHPWRWEDSKLTNTEIKDYLKAVRNGTIYEWTKQRG